MERKNAILSFLGIALLISSIGNIYQINLGPHNEPYNEIQIILKIGLYFYKDILKS